MPDYLFEKFELINKFREKNLL